MAHDVSKELRDPSGKWSDSGVIHRLSEEAKKASEAHKVGDKVIWKDKRGKERSATVTHVAKVRNSPEPHHYDLKLDQPTGRYQETTRYQIPHSQVRKA